MRSRFVHDPLLLRPLGSFAVFEMGSDNDDMQCIDLTSSVYTLRFILQ